MAGKGTSIITRMSNTSTGTATCAEGAFRRVTKVLKVLIEGQRVNNLTKSVS
jgi:hypothetical protein